MKVYDSHVSEGGVSIYTRNYGKQNRNGMKYSPPPGYDGNAFSDDTSVKLHEAEDDVAELPSRKREILNSAAVPDEMMADEIIDIFESNTPVIGDTASDLEYDNDNEKSGAEDSVQPKSLQPLGGSIHLIEALLKSLHGKFGREELIIVMVMLLIASEGASIELILLALILIAG